MEPEFAPKDFISMMPDNVVTNILHRLPLQDAVRTGILSRNWRFKWTMLSEVAFDTVFFVYLIERKGKNSYGMIASRLLLHFHGPITKFKLALNMLDAEDVLHMFMFLSKKGIKDLAIDNCSRWKVKLPIHLFSCLELKHLEVCCCIFDPPPSFHGFPNLLSLKLCLVEFGGSGLGLGEFISRCPLLEILRLDYLSYTGNVKLAEIAKLENLKILSLPLCNLETTSSYKVFELMSCLSKLQELGLDFQDRNLTEDGAMEFPTNVPSLKAFTITRINIANGIMLSRVLEMIKHFPNLQTLKFIATPQVDDPFPISIPIPLPEIEYNMVELQSVEFGNFRGLENEVYLIKYFLACSPSLKMISIDRDFELAPLEQLLFAKKLLKLHRASPVAEINLHF